jgi:predicted dehydrogenase
MRSFDVVIVGTGGIASVHAADLARLGGRAKVVAAVDVDADRLRGFAGKFDVPRTYASLEQMLATEDPDVIDLCTPPGLHRDQALACLADSRTVLCEKPPALSLIELDDIAGAGGSFATVSQHRFGSGAVNLRQLIAAGELGRPMTAVCHTLWYRPDDYFRVPWRGKWQLEGGGPTMGHGIHQMDLMLSILGPWREVVATAARQARPTETEDLSCAIVTFENGAMASVVNSLLSPRETSYLRFDFEHATVELEHLYGYQDKSWRITADPDRTKAWQAMPAGVSSGHAAQFAAVFDALEANVPPPVTLPEARMTLELIAAIYASAFTGRSVRRGEIGPRSPFYQRMDGSGTPWGRA